MTKKTIKEFAEDIGLTKKQVEDKLRYQKKIGNDFGTYSDSIRYLSDSEQESLCEIFGIPYFGSNSVVFGTSENSEHKEIISLQNQLLDLKADKEFLKKQLSEIQESSDKRDSEMRILLKQAQDYSKDLQLKIEHTDNNRFKNKLKRLFIGLKE